MLGLGALHLKTNRNQEALPLLQEAARLAPQEAKPFYLLGSAFNRLGRYTEAAAALEQAASRSPEDADVYYQLAHAYGHLHRPADGQKALERFRKIRASGEKFSESRREAARLAKGIRPIVDQKNIALALQMMEKAHELDPNNEEVCFRLANLYDTQKYELARDYAHSLRSGLPPSGVTYFYWA